MAKSYNRYEYETSPRKLEPYYAPKKQHKRQPIKKKTNKKAEYARLKREKEMKIKAVIYLIIGFAIFFGISYRNSKIDENFEKVQTLKAELEEIEKENAQMEVSIESSLNLTNLEQQARNILGMQKLTNKQTEYITLPKTDYIEAASEQVVIETNKSLVDKIGDFLSQLFK